MSHYCPLVSRHSMSQALRVRLLRSDSGRLGCLPHRQHGLEIERSSGLMALARRLVGHDETDCRVSMWLKELWLYVSLRSLGFKHVSLAESSFLVAKRNQGCVTEK